jgi:hypothetical protein
VRQNVQRQLEGDSAVDRRERIVAAARVAAPPLTTVEGPARHQQAQDRSATVSARGYGRPVPGRKRSALHLHRFRFASENPIGNGSFYACRCGVVKQSL